MNSLLFGGDVLVDKVDPLIPLTVPHLCRGPTVKKNKKKTDAVSKSTLFSVLLSAHRAYIFASQGTDQIPD